jgi:malonyl-CoA O-methyltransferase
MNKERIKKNFSRYAHLYDKYADVQRYAASKLIGKTDGKGIRDILEIGCGTGNYTLLLKKKFISADITALDISDKMIQIARGKISDDGINFGVFDAERIDFKKKFDLITSNASMQWFDDFGMAIKKYRSFLKEGGVMLFSIFGPLTFQRLNQILGKIFEKKFMISSCSFVDKEEIGRILAKDYKKVEIKEDVIEEEYSSLRDLLEKIKFTGERGGGMDGKVFMGPARFKKTEELYKESFGRIKAAYQIFYCKGEK